MDTQRTHSLDLRDTRPKVTSHLIPAALGICTAVLLGGTGFGLGCIYGQATAPASVAVQSAVVLPQTANSLVLAPLPPSAGTAAMGGPEDSGREDLAALTLVPVRLPAPQPERALPMTRPVVGGWVSSDFGQRLDPFTGRPAVHRGLDFAGLDNSAILAVAPGVVTRSGRQRGYGNLIEIDHGNGWVTRYGHNASNLVVPGDYVRPGQTIALMGSTGRATGTHLHFEVLYRGRHQNPTRFVPRDA